MLLPEWWFNPDLPTMIQSEQKKNVLQIQVKLRRFQWTAGQKQTWQHWFFHSCLNQLCPIQGSLYNSTQTDPQRGQITQNSHVCTFVRHQALWSLPMKNQQNKIQTEVTAVHSVQFFWSNIHLKLRNILKGAQPQYHVTKYSTRFFLLFFFKFQDAVIDSERFLREFWLEGIGRPWFRWCRFQVLYLKWRYLPT